MKSELPQPASRARKIPAERIDMAERLLLAGSAPRAIERALMDKFGVKRRQSRTYCALARKRISAAVASRGVEIDGEMVRQMLLDAFGVAKAGGVNGPNPNAMVSAARTFAEVTGVLKPAKVDVTSNGQTVCVDPTDPRWAQLQATHLGAARQGVSDEARPDGNADSLAPQ